MGIRTSAVVALCLGLGAVEAPAQTCPAIELQPVIVQCLTNAVFATHAGDGTGRLFAVEQEGTVKVLQPGASVPTLFLRVPVAKILADGERGLLT